MSSPSMLMLFALGFIWGATFFCTEILLLTMSPFHIVFFRVAIAAVIMLGLTYGRGYRLPLDKRSWQGFLAMGFVNNALPFSCIVFGQQYITGGLASILNSSAAFFTVMLAAMVFADERITAPRIIGTVLGVVGVAITIGFEHLGGFENFGQGGLGQFLIIIATISYAIAGIIGRKMVQNHAIEVAITGMLISSSLWMLVAALVVEGVPIMPIEATPILAMLAFAIPCTVFAYMLYFALLKRVGAGNTLLVTIIIPVFAVLLDSLVLGQLISLREGLGFAVIAVGLLVLAGKIPLPQKIQRE